MSPRVLPAALLSIIAFLTHAGCRGGGGATLLSPFGLAKQPLVIALIPKPGVLDPFARYEGLRKDMSEDVDLPVRLDLCLPIQVEPNLLLGFNQLAIVPCAQYVDMPQRAKTPILAVAIDDDGTDSRRALLVVPIDSDLTSVEQLKGHKVGFGPSGDARTHHAARALLRGNGVKLSDLSLELLPIPGTLRHFEKSDDLLRSVLAGDYDAGFVDERAFASLSKTGDGTAPSQDRLRIIGQTVPVPTELVIRSPKANDATLARVVEFLLSADERHPDALKSLNRSGFAEPSAALLDNLAKLTMPAGAAEQSDQDTAG